MLSRNLLAAVVAVSLVSSLHAQETPPPAAPPAVEAPPPADPVDKTVDETNAAIDEATKAAIDALEKAKQATSEVLDKAKEATEETLDSAEGEGKSEAPATDNTPAPPTVEPAAPDAPREL